MRRLTLLAATVLLAVPHPAEASTFPRIDFERRQWSLGAGINGVALVVPMPTASLDYAFTDRISLGVGGSAWSGWGRVSLRLWEGLNGMSLGTTLSGGFNSELIDRSSMRLYGQYVGPLLREGFSGTYSFYSQYEGPWFQPVLNLSIPLGPATSPWAVLRGTLGPLYGTGIFWVDPPDLTAPGAQITREARFAPALVSNLELAIPFHGGRQEVTLGGYGYVGWRAIF